jgi:hypothetical protein
MDALLVLASILVVIFGGGSCLVWVFGPLDRAARNRQFPMQFGLADLLCLFVLVQLPVGIVHWTFREDLQQGIVVLDIVLSVVATVVWWVCLQTLSRAGVHVVWHRCVVLALALPCGYAGSLAVIAVPFAALGLLVHGERSIAGWLMLAELAIVCVLYGFGRFNRMIVATAKETPPADSSEIVQ